MNKMLQSTATTSLRLTLSYDADAESPSDWDGWRLVSFGRKHSTYEAPDAFCAGLDVRGDPMPAHIGIRRKLEAGSAFWLSYYEHGQCRWSLIDEGPHCRWDSIRVAGLLLWGQPVRKLPVGFLPREEHARHFLDAYTAWDNGEVYRYLIEDEVGDHLGGCGGFYDPESMFQEIRPVTGGHVVSIEGDAAWLAEYYDAGARFQQINTTNGESL